MFAAVDKAELDWIAIQAVGEKGAAISPRRKLSQYVTEYGLATLQEYWLEDRNGTGTRVVQVN